MPKIDQISIDDQIIELEIFAELTRNCPLEFAFLDVEIKQLGSSRSLRIGTNVYNRIASSEALKELFPEILDAIREKLIEVKNGN